MGLKLCLFAKTRDVSLRVAIVNFMNLIEKRVLYEYFGNNSNFKIKTF